MAYGKAEQRCPHTRPRKHHSGYSKFLKLCKNRKERRRAKENPDCFPAYNFFNGYET
jgi:hypothetical protein